MELKYLSHKISLPRFCYKILILEKFSIPFTHLFRKRNICTRYNLGGCFSGVTVLSCSLYIVYQNKVGCQKVLCKSFPRCTAVFLVHVTTHHTTLTGGSTVYQGKMDKMPNFPNLFHNLIAIPSV